MLIQKPAPSQQARPAPSSLGGEGWGEGDFPASTAPLSPQDIYRSLMAVRAPGCDEFAAHVAACILAISAGGACEFTKPLCTSAGLSAQQFSTLVREFFPRAMAWRLFALCETVERPDEEICLFELLERCTTSRGPIELLFAAMIARRAQEPNHLWQDLGLNNRGELSELMNRHFKPLAMRNTGDMKWKKFFYRQICADEGFMLCAAPSCAECSDFENCFGEETGESLLARARRAAETA
jgi:nitrogen fixation protein NifQ